MPCDLQHVLFHSPRHLSGNFRLSGNFFVSVLRACYVPVAPLVYLQHIHRGKLSSDGIRTRTLHEESHQSEVEPRHCLPPPVGSHLPVRHDGLPELPPAIPLATTAAATAAAAAVPASPTESATASVTCISFTFTSVAITSATAAARRTQQVHLRASLRQKRSCGEHGACSANWRRCDRRICR